RRCDGPTESRRRPEVCGLASKFAPVSLCARVIDADRRRRQDAAPMAFILDTVRDLGRLREIAGVLARHGFGELLQRTGLASLVPGKKAETSEPRLSLRVRQVFEELGPTFVKLGQLLS